LDLTTRTLKKQLKGAEKSGARVAVIVDRTARGRVKWKDMAGRTQVDVEEEQLAAHAEANLDIQK
jgi:histidyl-tRNA synthetase